ncbi:hypothetical protein OG735_13560 [Streptomyces sp. NBC_01210]|uniref:hypothetical protein n=1 Tax=Streptomyces sp. NBC_01210 TaxID=2903774 RepID=UPI002E129E05|nr:hypothetical protein OG735_13560 [Streptomyces sp. NBC_01210]
MSAKIRLRRILSRIAIGTALLTAAPLAVVSGAAAQDIQPTASGTHFTSNPDPNGAPSARPAAGPEKATLAAASRPVSGKNPQAGPTFTQVSGVWNVNTSMAVLRNSVTDADGDKANLTFEVWTTDANGNPKTQVKLTDDNPYGVLVSGFVASGKTAEVTVPNGKLKPGTTYTFHTSAYDGSLYETAWSPWAKFRIHAHSVDITLPAPNDKAVNPAFDNSWQPVPGWGSIETKKLVGVNERHCQPAGNGNQLCITSSPATKADITKAKESRGRLKGIRAAAPPLNDTCEVGATQGKYVSIFTRDAACMYNKLSVEVTDEQQTESKGYQEFLMSYHMKTAMTGIDLKLWARITPLPMPAGKVPFPAQPGAIKLTITPMCSAGCVDKPSYAWDGNLMWGGSYDIDPHEETGTATVKWSGGVPDESGKKDRDLSQDMAFAPFATFSTSVPETFPTDKSHGLIGNPVYARCDMVYSPAGCVFRDYMPGYVFNTAKAPAAAAHAWLINTKIREGAPLNYLPDRRGETGAHGERNAYGRDPDANRRVICPDGWAANNGHPDTTTVPDISTNDKPSCDEFAFAASYNSGGMPKDMEGTNPVTSGDQCVQTFATKLTDGTWKLYDDERKAGPTWKEVCGRSAMSEWVNSTSMARFSTFTSQFRLLDQDLYFVRTPGFEKCDASKAIVKCDIR